MLLLRKESTKGCQLSTTKVENQSFQKEENMIETLEVVTEFEDVFLEESLMFPPKREIDFYIELIPGVASVSKVPYQMIVPELMELKIQL